MQILRIVAVAGFVLGLLGSPTLASAFSTGAMIRIQSAQPAGLGSFLDEVVTVGPGIESSGFGAVTSIDLFDGGMQLGFIGPFTLGDSPNGLLFSDFGGTMDPIDNVSINPATTVGEFFFGFTEDTIEVDVGGLTVANGDIIVLDVALEPTVIPEPTSIALLGLGLTGLVIFRRRRGAAL